MLNIEKPKFRILVCGGRGFGRVPDIIPEDIPYEDFLKKAESEQLMLRTVLESLKKSLDIEVIIEGGAEGADTLAGNWADEAHIPRATYPADWKKNGKKAGPIRNQQMLDKGKPSIVVAFPGGKGTKDMVKRAKDAGLAVYEVSYEVVSEES